MLRKYWLFNIILALVFLLIIYRFYYVLLSPKVDGHNLASFEKNIQSKKEVLSSNRGSIFDVNGNVLGESIKVYQIVAYLDPKRSKNAGKTEHVADKDLTANTIASIIGEDPEKLKEYLNSDSYQTFLGDKSFKISVAQKNEIESHQLPGIDFIEKEDRSYKYGVFASYTIGYAKYYEDLGKGKDGIVGELGIEAAYNDELTGKDGYKEFVSDAVGNRIPNTVQTIKDPVNGSDIYTTIDKDVQLYVETAVKEAYEKYNTSDIGLVIADAKTGKILASSTYPSFNPNYKDMKSFINPLHEATFEPGSTMKIFSFASTINEGKYNGSELYTSGAYSLYGDTITDWNGKGWGQITFDQGFYLSSNVASSTLANDKLGTQKLFEYYDKFGFGKKTNFDLPNEAAGQITKDNPINTVTASFGQGLSITPVQMIQALTAISNNGDMMQPYIIDKIVDSNGNISYKSEPVVSGDNILKQETVDKVKDLMYANVNGNYDGNHPGIIYTGQPYNIPGYSILGKTGTAQYVRSDGRYTTSQGNDAVFSFAGMFPRDEPKVVFYSWAKDPSHGKGTVNAEMIQSVIPNISNHYGLFSTDAKITSKVGYVIDYRKMSTENAKKLLDLNSTSKYAIIGEGSEIVDQYPVPRSKISSYSTVFLLSNSVTTMPSFIGYNYLDAAVIANFLNIKLEFNGVGKITSQTIEAGTPLEGVTSIGVTLE